MGILLPIMIANMAEKHSLKSSGYSTQLIGMTPDNNMIVLGGGNHISENKLRIKIMAESVRKAADNHIPTVILCRDRILQTQLMQAYGGNKSFVFIGRDGYNPVFGDAGGMKYVLDKVISAYAVYSGIQDRSDLITASALLCDLLAYNSDGGRLSLSEFYVLMDMIRTADDILDFFSRYSCTTGREVPPYLRNMLNLEWEKGLVQLYSMMNTMRYQYGDALAADDTFDLTAMLDSGKCVVMTLEPDNSELLSALMFAQLSCCHHRHGRLFGCIAYNVPFPKFAVELFKVRSDDTANLFTIIWQDTIDSLGLDIASMTALDTVACLGTGEKDAAALASLYNSQQMAFTGGIHIGGHGGGHIGKAMMPAIPLEKLSPNAISPGGAVLITRNGYRYCKCLV